MIVEHTIVAVNQNILFPGKLFHKWWCDVNRQVFVWSIFALLLSTIGTWKVPVNEYYHHITSKRSTSLKATY